MSPILINSSTTNVSTNLSTAKIANLSSKKKIPGEEVGASFDSIDENKDDEEAREERKSTGRSIAIVIFIALMCLALYHVIQRKTTILAGILVPGLILFSYTFFMIHTSSQEKKRLKLLENTANDLELSVHSDSIKQDLQKNASTISNPAVISGSSASIPSTSGVVLSSNRNVSKAPMPASFTKMDPKTAKLFMEMKALNAQNIKTQMDQKSNPNQSKKVPPPFKKAQSQSHMQAKSIQSTTHVSIEHEKKKPLKKSRSFDKNIGESHMIDSKRVKAKH